MSKQVKVPFADLHAQYLNIKKEMDAAIAGVIGSSAFIRGPYVDAFEKEFAALIGAPHCVSAANGTDSLYIAMRALGVKPGDEVIVPAHSWIATSETVTQAGGTVVFCDTDEDTFTIDPALIEAKITPRTVGIIPVHLYGQAADMGPIMETAARHRLWVLEDCAQAHLAAWNGRTVGTFGAAASFSFYPGKNLGAMGDAGALVTADGVLAERMAMLARHGGLVKNEHRIEGVNSRLDGLQAAVLSVKMKHLRKWTAERRKLAGVYDRELSGIEGLEIPIVAGGREHVYHIYALRHQRRDELKKFLAERGIETVINYPVALPFLPAYARLGARPEDFPNAYRHQSTVLSLPLFPEMTPEQQAAVIDAVKTFCRG
ncbi:MAG: erythromycin biosynthesis sensory transduction protein eryC1 [Elusimicrobia bacterium GWA2_62_23]|nr:MAG: erythromycin biosynthesis sensory transduction protein eryC1 [Elusimicrobia bacterium GWA2_62_23]